jgi:hypothetical protein
VALACSLVLVFFIVKRSRVPASHPVKEHTVAAAPPQEATQTPIAPPSPKVVAPVPAEVPAPQTPAPPASVASADPKPPAGEEPSDSPPKPKKVKTGQGPSAAACVDPQLGEGMSKVKKVDVTHCLPYPSDDPAHASIRIFESPDGKIQAAREPGSKFRDKCIANAVNGAALRITPFSGKPCSFKQSYTFSPP